MNAAIELDGVAVELVGQQILEGITLRVACGEIVAVMGPSGSGKTSLLRAMTGFIVPSRGTVALNGNLASTNGRVVIPPEQRNLAMVFQDLALWPHLTVYGNLAFGLGMSQPLLN